MKTTKKYPGCDTCSECYVRDAGGASVGANDAPSTEWKCARSWMYWDPRCPCCYHHGDEECPNYISDLEDFE